LRCTMLFIEKEDAVAWVVFATLIIIFVVVFSFIKIENGVTGLAVLEQQSVGVDLSKSYYYAGGFLEGEANINLERFPPDVRLAVFVGKDRRVEVRLKDLLADLGIIYRVEGGKIVPDEPVSFLLSELRISVPRTSGSYELRMALSDGSWEASAFFDVAVY